VASEQVTEFVTVNTAFGQRRSEYDVRTGNSDDIAKACGVIRNAIKGLPGVSDNPAPEAILWKLAGSSVNIRVRWWTEPQQADVVQVRGHVIRAVKRALGEAGINLPFPTNVVLLHDQTGEADGDRTRQREGWPPGDSPPAPRHLNEVTVDRKGEQGRMEEVSRPTRRH